MTKRLEERPDFCSIKFSPTRSALISQFHFLDSPPEDVPAHAYLHERPEPVGKVEDSDPIGEDGEIGIEDVVVGHDYDETEKS